MNITKKIFWLIPVIYITAWCQVRVPQGLRVPSKMTVSKAGSAGGGSCGAGSVTLEGVCYTLTAHPRGWVDGPSGPKTLSLSNTSTGLPRAGNDYYARLQANWSFLYNNTDHLPGRNCWDGTSATGFLCLNGMAPADGGRNGAHPMLPGLLAAVLWKAGGSNPSDTTYLPTAKWAINHIEDYLGGSTGCDETVSYCGRDQMMDYGRQYFEEPALLYTLVRSQLTSTEIRIFNAKIWNGNAQSNNGLGGKASDPTAACVNQGLSDGTGTIDISGTAVTFSSPVLDASWIGAGLYGFYPDSDENNNAGRIVSITDSTHGVLSRLETTISAARYRYSKSWQEDVGTGVGNCGIHWFLFHDRDNWPWMSASIPDPTWMSSYPPDASSSAASYLFDPGYGIWTSGTPDSRRVAAGPNNKTWGELDGFLSIALATADDDVRARSFATYVYDFWYKWTIPIEKSLDGGSISSGAGYTSGRVHDPAVAIAQTLCNSIGSGSLPCTIAKGKYIDNIIPYYLYMPKVGDVSDGQGMSIQAWGAETGADEQNYRSPACGAANFNGTSVMIPWMNWQFNHRLSQDYIVWQGVKEYLWCSDLPEADPQTNGAPNQYLMAQNDYATCVANPNWTAINNCHQNAVFAKAVSQTGFTAADTHVLVTGAGSVEPQTLDHANAYDPGHFQIWRGTNGQPNVDNDWLLRFDNLANVADGGVRMPSYNTIVLGDPASVTNTLWKSDYLHVAQVSTDRWGGVNPTGPTTNDYMYMLINMNPSLATSTVFLPLWTSAVGPIDVQRQIIHSRPSGAQDFVVAYDYAHTSVGEQLQSFWHFGLVGVNNRTGFSFSAGSMTASIIHAGTGAEMLAKFFTVAGAGTTILTADNSDGSWTPSNNLTSRVYTCAASGGSCDPSATNYEALAVFMPVLSTSASLPTINQLSATATGGNATVLEIQASTTPQVVSFGRKGALLSVEGFTTGFTGTALYILSGLTAGSHAITVGGTPVSGSPFTVVAGDSTVRFTAGPGAVVIN